MTTSTLTCLLLNERAKLPVRQTPGSVGYDVSSCEHVVVPARGWAVIPTGVKLHLDGEGAYVQLASRSGLASKYGLFCAAGVVDIDYSGEIKVIMMNHSDLDRVFAPGDRVAQIVVTCVALPRVVEATPEQYASLTSAFSRGDNGFGSTGISG